MNSKKIIAACAQIKPTFGDTEGNMKRIIRDIESTEADLILFPELATSGYQFRNREELLELSLDLENGAEIKQFKRIANELNRHLAIGIPERVGNLAYNSLELFEPSGTVSIYLKLHLFY